MQQLNVSNCDT